MIFNFEVDNGWERIFGTVEAASKEAAEAAVEAKWPAEHFHRHVVYIEIPVRDANGICINHEWTAED